MKITHLVDKGLTEGETARLSTLLRGLSSEFELGLVAPEDSALVRELSGTRVKICPLKRHKEQRLLSTDIYKILMLLGKERPSVLHLHSSYAVGRAARALGVRALVSEGEGSEGLKRGRVGDKFASFAISRTEGHSSELMKGGVSPSRIKSLGCGVPELVPNGHSCELTVISKCLCIDEYRLVISALGRLSPKLDVRAELFVGEGELLAARRLAALICPLGRIRVSKREDFSRFAPTLPSVFVYPVASDTRLPLLPMRFMSAGVPVLLSDTAQNREFFDICSGAHFFSVGDPFSLARRLSTIVSDTSLYESSSASARRTWEERYSPENMIDDYGRFYRAIARADASIG